MAYKIIWSPEAIDSFDSIIDYLRSRFTEREVAKFVNIVNRRLLLIEKFPQTAGKVSKTSGRRKAVIHKRTILIYKILERKRTAELLIFFDTRQYPRRLKF